MALTTNDEEPGNFGVVCTDIAVFAVPKTLNVIYYG
jgi:hypothetical protein